MTDSTPTKIAYCIAAWSGDRRYMPEGYKKDRTFFLRNQVEQLRKLKHSISNVIVIDPDFDSTPENYRAFLNDLPGMLSPLPCTVVRRSNMALSYGSWLHAYELFGEAFTHYFIIEDDYFPVLDNFDTEFLTLMNETLWCGAVFAAMEERENPHWWIKRFASAPHGLIATWAFTRARNLLRSVSTRKMRHNYSDFYQVHWTSAFWRSGVKTIDVRSKFRVGFASRLQHQWLFEENPVPILDALV